MFGLSTVEYDVGLAISVSIGLVHRSTIEGGE